MTSFLNKEHPKTTYEQDKNNSIYKFLIREFYLKAMDRLEIIDNITSTFLSKMTSIIKTHYFSVRILDITLI